MQDELEIQRVDRHAGVTAAGPDVVGRLQSPAELRVAILEAVPGARASRQERRVGRVREDRVALQLRQRERRDEAPDDPVQQARHHRVGIGDRAVHEGVGLRREAVEDATHVRVEPLEHRLVGEYRAELRPVVDTAIRTIHRCPKARVDCRTGWAAYGSRRTATFGT